MKGDFEINISRIKKAGDRYDEMSKTLTECLERLEQIRRDLPQHSYGDIRKVLESLEEEQRTNIRGMKSMQDTLRDIVQCYEDTEKRIADTRVGKPPKLELIEESRERLDHLLKELIKMLKGMNETCCNYGGDPINLATGNFIYHREYLKLKGLYPMAFRMSYNSVEPADGVLGRGWVHNYQIKIRLENRRAVLHWSDGREEIFQKDQEGHYVHLIGKHDVLMEIPEGLLYQTTLGQRYVFDKEGRAGKAIDANGNELLFSYDEAGKLAEVKSVSGEGLRFCYSSKGMLEEVSDSAGRSVTLCYEDGFLAQVKDEENHVFQYEYDSKGNLSQIANGRKITSIRNEYDQEGRVTRQIYPDGGAMEIAYDDEAGILHVTEQNGNKIDYFHDEHFRSVRTVYADGQIQYAYNEQNQKTQVIDKRGYKTKYSYDEAGNLTLVENPLGEKMEMEYDAGKRMTQIRVCGKDLWKNEYDGRGNLIRRQDALGRKFGVFYHENGRPTEIIQPDGSSIKLEYDAHGNLCSIREPLGGETHYEYDALGQVTAAVDGNGNRMEYAYNRRGHITRVTNAEGNTRHFSYNESGKVTCVEDYDGSRIQREYNEINKLSRMTDQEGGVTELEYDKMWNMTRKVDARGGETRFLYDGLNRLERVINAKGAQFRYEYDANGNRTKIVDPQGAAVNMEYDALNRLIRIEDADGAVSHVEYNFLGQRTKLTDAMGNVRRIVYDQAGQKIKTVDAKGNEVRYRYNAMGKVSEVTDPAGRKTTYEYLPGGLLAKVIHADGTFVSYTYDRNRNVKSKSTQTGYTLTYHYDCMNRITEIESSEGQRKHYTYDAAGNVSSMTDANGNTTRYQYSSGGRLTSVTDALGNRTEYGYDKMGGLSEVHQYGCEEELKEACELNQSSQKHQFVSYQRDILGHVETAKDALGNEEHYVYDDLGRVIEKLDAEGYLTTYGYTGGGQLAQIQYADGNAVKFSYNPLKQLAEITDWLGTTSIEMDELGRPEKITDHKGRVTAYTRGELGQRLEVRYPGGKSVAYGYDELMRLTSLRDENGEIQYGYDKDGRLSEKLLPNGIQTDYTYYSNGMLEGLEHSDSEGLLDCCAYRYDAAGNKTEVRRMRRGMPEESGAYRYAYDALSRLTQVEKEGETLRRYGYDAFGNRSFLEMEENRTDYTYNGANQLIHAVNAEGTTDYSYDARGNLIQVMEDEVLRHTYDYDCRNRLHQAADNRGRTSVYCYNGLGQRVGQQITDNQNPARDIEYVLDQTKRYNNLLQQVEGGDIREFLWDGNVAGTQGKDGVHYYLQDELGSPLRYTDAAGMVRESYIFDEFGNEAANGQEKGREKSQLFGYAGFYQDEVSGTLFVQAREYAPQTGRFTARDLVRGIQTAPYTLNQYSYCWNRPMTLVDYDGAFPSLLDIQEGVSDWADAAGEWVGDTVNGAGEMLSGATSTFFDGADYVWENCIPPEVQMVIGGIGDAALGGGRELLELEVLGISASDVMAELTKSWPGEVFLNIADFNRTSDGVYHANQNCWQAPFGYNDFYDYVFNGATSCDKKKYPFTTADGTSYTIWMWKGDYLNLGAGCETGIYYGDGYHLNSATDTNLHMTLALYDKERGEYIFRYNPNDPQWWITGFNPDYQDKDKSVLEVSGSIDFSEEPELWDAFYKEYSKKKGWCFDEENKIMFYQW